MTPQHHLEFPPPRPGFLMASQRTESTFESIPVIDISGITHANSNERRELADRIRDACINVGFFYLQNHGIPEDLIRDAIKAAKAFFALPESIKMKEHHSFSSEVVLMLITNFICKQLDIHKTPNFKGYTPLLGENTNPEGQGDLHEGFDFGWELQSTLQEKYTPGDGPMSGNNVWPEELPGFKESVLAYYHHAFTLGQLLFPLFALALDLPENYFDDKTTKPAAIMRLLHYPPQAPTNEKQIGIGAHTDYECFTILWQDPSGGLQVQNASGTWVDAVPIPGTVVVNLGDQFARWTNDVFKSTMHRVINRSGAERYSIPLFFGTDYDVLLEPIPTCVTPSAPAKYEVVTAGEYVKSRLEATYVHSAPST